MPEMQSLRPAHAPALFAFDGICSFHVLVGAGGEVLRRMNLVDVMEGGADLGYRIAERAAGRVLATWAVREKTAT